MGERLVCIICIEYIYCSSTNRPARGENALPAYILLKIYRIGM
ncbi:hypothetical protein M116_3489 [Bacteroides fragilis str. 3719 A10]|uniref:Uncharacterized protein n=3 Tax=Bacteroides fragilis TaxID=817 RepID=A0A015TRQ5_BACFG|nr:hypothetical protein M124_2906 [Bacteroides fragilis str. 3988T(B)14]EXY79287.1 hypothetical protein M084_2969 [Bacteroides fragilis str. 3988 T1]EXZ56906.1 hypothetical protein M116_3489 [Bacteroides fragilis str. 3719 A10]EXZ72121.1 hypothetical protein M123_3606 [Bacteroides fragilis str. 3976T8]EYA84061.1 hypothetical protein M137_4253 [Bacteroides fragilis str. S36L12]EYB08450.1 hypothetical protein M119_3474 [Bacteroides fragilis str. 3783N1-6]EYE62081.1 hypothetical protein M149_380